jgi:hypothetical protein
MSVHEGSVGGSRWEWWRPVDRSLGPSPIWRDVIQGSVLVHVNVIPLNPTPGSRWDAAPKPVEREFVRRVNTGGVACTVRDTRCQEIAAACGQLAAKG